MTVMHCSTACFDGKVPDMSDDPLGLVDRSADHNDIVDVLLGARELVQRFAALALEPDALAAAPDERSRTPSPWRAFHSQPSPQPC